MDLCKCCINTSNLDIYDILMNFRFMKIKIFLAKKVINYICMNNEFLKVNIFLPKNQKPFFFNLLILGHKKIQYIKGILKDA